MHILAAHPTGSRYICPDFIRKDSDLDTVVLVKKIDVVTNILQADGWVGPINDYANMSSFASLKKERPDGIVENLIITEDESFYHKFVLATDVAKRLRLTVKDDRIVLFNAILYGNADGEGPTDDEVPF